VDRVKSEYSEDDVPLDPAVAQVLQEWSEDCPRLPRAGYSRTQQHASRITRVKFARTTYGRPEKTWALGRSGGIRHTYRTLLDETGAPMKVQQELMRHANIQTTMNVYGSAMLESKRTANSKIVRLVLVPSFQQGNEKGRVPAAWSAPPPTTTELVLP